jgi:hypothetical protein
VFLKDERRRATHDPAAEETDPYGHLNPFEIIDSLAKTYRVRSAVPCYQTTPGFPPDFGTLGLGRPKLG